MNDRCLGTQYVNNFEPTEETYIDQRKLDSTAPTKTKDMRVTSQTIAGEMLSLAF